MTNEAVLLSREVISIFIREAVLRCIREAEKEDTSSVTIEHLEKILPQLLLDF